MIKVNVLNKQHFDYEMKSNGVTDENVEEFNTTMIISIVDSQEWSQSRIPYFKENHNNVIILRFDDVEHDGEGFPVLWDDDRTKINFESKAFSKKQAKELFEFIKRNRNANHCIVHCMGGISRSGAVGTFVNGYCGGDWETFKRNNPQIVPNARVLRMLNNEKYNNYESENS